MRRHSLIKNDSQLPKLYLRNITSRLQSDSQQFSSINQQFPTSSLQKFQQQFSEQPQTPHIKFRVNRTYSKTAKTEADIPDSPLIKGLVKVGQQISELRRQINARRYSKQQSFNGKLGRLVTELEDRHRQQRNRPVYSQMQSPLYIPVPMPFPMYNFGQSPPQPSENYRRTNKSFNMQQKTARIRRSKKKWKRAVNAILFIFYLRRFIKISQINRKKKFSSFMANIKPQLGAVRKQMIQAITPFLQILLVKRQVQFDFEENDAKEVIYQKITSIRKLVGLVIQSLATFAKKRSSKLEFVESLYYLCKHGNYSCTEPLLTRQQLQISCISQKFGYISADCNLQKVNLINLILIKMLLFNTLLSPNKIGTQFMEETISNNLYLVASVIYQLAIDIQDEFMLMVPPSYRIGNYQIVGKMRVLQSIVMKNSEHREGQLISGLKDQNWIKKYFSFKYWTEEKRNLRKLIDLMHSLMVGFHSKQCQKYF